VREVEGREVERREREGWEKGKEDSLTCPCPSTFRRADVKMGVLVYVLFSLRPSCCALAPPPSPNIPSLQSKTVPTRTRCFCLAKVIVLRDLNIIFVNLFSSPTLIGSSHTFHFEEIPDSYQIRFMLGKDRIGLQTSDGERWMRTSCDTATPRCPFQSLWDRIVPAGRNSWMNSADLAAVNP
jgi:hypothetical protein